MPADGVLLAFGYPQAREDDAQFQAQVLQAMLDETGWNVIETARRLDLARAHVYNLIRAFGLERTSR